MGISRGTRSILLGGVGVVAALALSGIGLALAQRSHSGHGQEVAPPAAPTRPAPVPGARSPRRVTMEELHRAGGVPRGWKFAVPAGDAARGRQLFADLECYKCHVIKGELLPTPADEAQAKGPELTGMGGKHPAEYLAESVLAPNHVIVEGPGYTGPDGLSTMPSFADNLSLAQWLDLVAYLKSLTGASDAPHDGHEIEREQVAGDYRIRLVYVSPAPAGEHPGAGRPHAAGHESAATKPMLGPGRLSVFVTDREFDEPVPYLPIIAAVQAERRPTERLRLAPQMGEQGFHYQLDFTLPPRTQKITLSIGPTTLPLARDRFTRAVSVVFEWGAAGQ
jgi:mono/diheme cytochrome c family protein